MDFPKLTGNHTLPRGLVSTQMQYFRSACHTLISIYSDESASCTRCSTSVQLHLDWLFISCLAGVIYFITIVYTIVYTLFIGQVVTIVAFRSCQSVYNIIGHSVQLNMIVACSENEAYHAYQMFNGRWYSGRQIQCSFTSVDKWKPAICGELIISRKRLFNNSFDVWFFKWVALLWPFRGAFCRSSLIHFACIRVAPPWLVTWPVKREQLQCRQNGSNLI